MKLNDYIANQQKKVQEDKDQQKRDRINLNLEKQEFGEKIENAHLKFIKDLVSLSKSQVFEFKDLKRVVEKDKMIQEIEINVYSQPMPEQYYIDLKADFSQDKEGVYFNIFSSGYDSSLEEKYLTFEEFNELDFEEFLVDCFNEFE